MIYNYDLLSFQILTVEHIAHPNGSFFVKARPFAALSFRLGGKGQFEIDGKNLVAKVGDVMYLPAGKSYRVDYSFSEFIVVHLPNCNYTEAEVIQIPDRGSIEALFVRLQDAWKTNHSANQAKAYVYEILHKLSETSGASELVSDPELEKCVQYLQDHVCESAMRVDTLCRHSFISRSSLQRYFMRRFGISPKQYILRLRLEKAMDLLMQNDLTIAEVAAACGFDDAKYFSRIFKQSYGISPSHIRSRTHI